MSTTFKQLNIGDTFDFVSGSYTDSFLRPCRKVSARKYITEGLLGETHAYQVGSVNTKVYHVNQVIAPNYFHLRGVTVN